MIINIRYSYVACILAVGMVVTIFQTTAYSQGKGSISIEAQADLALDELKTDQAQVNQLVNKQGLSPKGTGQPTKTEPTKTEPTKTEPTKTEPTKKTEPVVSPPRIAPEDVERLKFAEQYMKMASERLEEAKRAPNPAAAQVLFREGTLKAQQGRNLLRRVQASQLLTQEQPKSSAPPVSTQAPPGPSRQGLLSYGTSKAVFQAQQIDLLNISFDNPNLTGTQNAVKIDPKVPIITTRTGKPVNVEAVIRTMDRLPNSSGTNFFRTVDLPNGESVITVDPKKLEALNDPRNKEEIERIGGVSLQVTLDLLSYLGLPEFRQRGPVKVVESPILLSLKRLYSAVHPFAETVERWNTLPDNLRYPGSVERIHGFVLDEKNQDVLLVCSAARNRTTRLDIDCLILGLRAVWRDGVVPTVSLDPPSHRKAGPNYSRVEGIPIDTTFARIMLEADYAMKRIVFGDREAGIPEIRKIKESSIDSGDWGGMSRYWLSPVPVGPGQLHVSPTYRTLLFDSSVRCMTEEETVPGQWSGKPNPYDEKIARLFTEAYDRLELSVQIAPSWIYLRLHALVDVVTVGKVLRDMRIRSSAITDFVELPVRKTVGAEATPRSYAKIEVVIRPATELNDFEYSVEGGAVLNSRVGRRSLDMYQDATTLTLEHAADQFAKDPGFTSRLDFTFALPRTVDFTQSRIDLLMLKGERAAEELEFEIARDCFEQVTRDDPYYAEAWAHLALAHSGLGEHELAKTAIQKAIDLEPNDLELFWSEFEVFIAAAERNAEAVDTAIAEQYDELTLRYLSARLVQIASANLDQNADAEDVRKQIDIALELWEENGLAWYARSRTWGDPLGAEARKDRQKAIEVEEATLGENPQLLVQVIAFDSQTRLDAIGIMSPDMIDKLRKDEKSASLAKLELGDISLQLDLADLYDAWSILPSGLREQAFAMNSAIVLEVGGDTTEIQRAIDEMKEARKAADEVIKEHPKSPDINLARAVVLMMCERVRSQLPFMSKVRVDQAQAEIRQQLDEAIRLDSSFGSAYMWRAAFEAGRGDREKAMADVRMIGRITPSLRERVEEQIEQILRANAVMKSKPPATRDSPVAKKPGGDSPERRATIALLDVLKMGLREYQNERKEFPDSGVVNLARELSPQGLGVVNFAKGQLDAKRQIVDGWKHPIVYQRMGSGFRVYSTGPDGIDDKGAGDDIELPDK